MIVPVVALNPALLLPARMVTLAGTVMSGEFELSETKVLAAAVCDSVTVQAVIADDGKLLGLQIKDVTCTAATREIEAD